MQFSALNNDMPIFEEKKIKNFFDYPEEEKKRIILLAAKKANKKQRESVKKAEQMYLGI